MRPWIEVNTEEELKSTYNFPQCPEENFKQIYEVVSGIHSLRKGQAVHSHLRRCEVEEDFDEDDIADYEGMIYSLILAYLLICSWTLKKIPKLLELFLIFLADIL